VLGGLDSEEAANALGAALLDPEAAVRHAAVVGLTGQRSAAVTRFLELAAHDGDEPVRLLAKDLLARRIANEMPARIP
jgi:HEAT repeat protein